VGVARASHGTQVKSTLHVTVTRHTSHITRHTSHVNRVSGQGRLWVHGGTARKYHGTMTGDMNLLLLLLLLLLLMMALFASTIAMK
jgi:hypothetical protein